MNANQSTQLLIFLLLLPALSSAQDCLPGRYRQLIQEANQAAFGKNPDYELAINKLLSAKTCQPDSEAVVNVRIVEVFKEVNRQRALAVRNEAKANASAAINAGKTLPENLNRGYLLSDYAFQKNPTDPATLGLLLQTYYAHCFELGDSLIAPPFYRDIFTVPAPGTLVWADAATKVGRLLVSDEEHIWVLDSNGQVLYQFSRALLGIPEILGLKIMPDGKQLILLHRSGNRLVALLYDLESQSTRTFPLFNAVNPIAMSIGIRGFEVGLDGTTIAVASPDSVKVFDLTNGQCLGQTVFEGGNASGILETEAQGPIANIKYDQHDKTGLIVTTSDKVKHWNWDTDAAPSELFRSKESSLGLMDACFSPDGQFLVMLEHTDEPFFRFNGAYSGGKLIITQPSADKKKILFRQPASMPAAFKQICFIDNSTMALGANTDAIYLYRLRYVSERVDLLPMVQLAGHGHDVAFLAPGSAQHPGIFSFSPDNTVKYWPFHTMSAAFQKFQRASTIDSRDWKSGTFSTDYTSVAWSLKVGKLFASNQTQEIWAQVNGIPFRMPVSTSDPRTQVCFAWQGNQQLAIGLQKHLFVFRWPGPIQVAQWELTDTLQDLRYVGTKLLALTSSMLLRGIGDQAPVQFWAHPGLNRILRLSAQGDVAVESNQEVCIVSPQGRILHRYPDIRAMTMAISADFRYLAFGDLQDLFSGGITLLDLGSGKRQLLRGHIARCTSLDFSPDNRFLVSASDDRSWRLWNMATGESILQQPLHEVAFVKFCQKGQALAFYYRLPLDRDNGLINSVPTLRILDCTVASIYDKVRRTGAFTLYQQQIDRLRYNIPH